MKAQLTIDLTPAQHNEIKQFVMDHKQPEENFTLIGYPWLGETPGVFRISLWHGHEAAAAQRILQAALDEAAVLDNSGQDAH